MNEMIRKFELEKNRAFKEILESGLSETDKLARAFAWLTEREIRRGEDEIELFRAMGDQEALVKEQIKVSTIKHSRELFAFCYQRMTGRSQWIG
jgi:hypothetical protein